MVEKAAYVMGDSLIISEMLNTTVEKTFFAL